MSGCIIPKNHIYIYWSYQVRKEYCKIHDSLYLVNICITYTYNAYTPQAHDILLHTYIIGVLFHPYNMLFLCKLAYILGAHNVLTSASAPTLCTLLEHLILNEIG